MPANDNDEPEYPGNARQRALLRAIVAHYAGDARVCAVALFGSLVRGNWDDWSDLDLDIVVTNEAHLDVLAEVRTLCVALERIGEHAALIIADGPEAADVVFVSLNQFSVRFHPLASTSPNIVDHLLVLGGPLDQDSIVAAGRVNRRDERPALALLLDACIRDALYVAICLTRGNLWQAIALLERMRGRLIELFTVAHGGTRAKETLQAQASPALLSALARTLPQASAASVGEALAAMFALLEGHLDEISAGTLRLTDEQRQVIAAVRASLAQGA